MSSGQLHPTATFLSLIFYLPPRVLGTLFVTLHPKKWRTDEYFRERNIKHFKGEVLLGTFTKKVKHRKEIVGTVSQNCITSSGNFQTKVYKWKYFLSHRVFPVTKTTTVLFHLPHKERIYRLPKRKPPSCNRC